MYGQYLQINREHENYNESDIQVQVKLNIWNIPCESRGKYYTRSFLRQFLNLQTA